MDEAIVRENIATLLARVDGGDQVAADELLPQVYDALRALAARRMAREPAGHTLQATALVSEAYLRLLGPDGDGSQAAWNSRGHFYGAAAEAMRRILVERARRVGRLRHGGDRDRVSLTLADPATDGDDPIDLIALDDALRALEASDERAASIVTLRYFAGLSIQDTARALDLAERTVRRTWSSARLWLFDRMNGGDE